MQAIVAWLADQPRRFLLLGRDLPHVVPLRMQRRGRGGALHHGFIGADERHEIADAHDAELAAFRAPQRRLVQRRKLRAAARLAQDARVQHVRPHHVMDEGGTRQLRRQIAPRHRLADIAIRRVRLRRRVAFDIAREILGGGEIPVVVPGRRIAAAEHAILHRQFRRAAVQPLRQPIQHARAQLRRHQPHRTAGYLDRLAARGLAFVRRILRYRPTAPRCAPGPRPVHRRRSAPAR